MSWSFLEPSLRGIIDGLESITFDSGNGLITKGQGLITKAPITKDSKAKIIILLFRMLQSIF